jgi:hypothetical protein
MGGGGAGMKAEEIIKTRIQGIEWVYSEGLHCLWCGHRGLWLGNDWLCDALEHLCTACDKLWAVHPVVMELIRKHDKEDRRNQLRALEVIR